MRKFDGYLRGVNLGGWLSQCVAYTEEHFNGFITEEDIKTIASFGLDHIRVPVDYDVFMAVIGANKIDRRTAKTNHRENRPDGICHDGDAVRLCSDQANEVAQ